jgi:hypothetical protein
VKKDNSSTFLTLARGTESSSATKQRPQVHLQAAKQLFIAPKNVEKAPWQRFIVPERMRRKASLYTRACWGQVEIPSEETYALKGITLTKTNNPNAHKNATKAPRATDVALVSLHIPQRRDSLPSTGISRQPMPAFAPSNTF